MSEYASEVSCKSSDFVFGDNGWAYILHLSVLSSLASHLQEGEWGGKGESLGTRLYMSDCIELY